MAQSFYFADVFLPKLHWSSLRSMTQFNQLIFDKNMVMGGVGQKIRIEYIFKN